jgi:Cupin-like domain
MSSTLNGTRSVGGAIPGMSSGSRVMAGSREKLQIDPATFNSSFDRRGFYVHHNLADHPLLQLPAIAALAQRLPKDLLEWNTEQDGAFTNPDVLKPHHMSCKDTILALESQPARILLLQLEHDPEYKQLMDDLLDGIEPLSEELRPGMWERHSFLFISSRAAYTPFHFDPDYNFLLQVRGDKIIYMWDPTDRDVLPYASIDKYYAGRGTDSPYANRNQAYRDEFLRRAQQYPMKPGEGVHLPLHVPHAVRTESDVSISLSITFQTRLSKFNASVHGANFHVRRLGVNPPPPGHSRLWDVAANFGFRAMRKVAALGR